MDWLPILVVVIALPAAILAIRSIRRWTRQSDLPPAGGFTLADLRKLHKEGKMSEEEYKKAAARVVGAQTAQLLGPEKKDHPEPPVR
jgi:hypothetical protein